MRSGSLPVNAVRAAMMLLARDEPQFRRHPKGTPPSSGARFPSPNSDLTESAIFPAPCRNDDVRSAGRDKAVENMDHQRPHVHC